jgi:hypothetical protein
LLNNGRIQIREAQKLTDPLYSVASRIPQFFLLNT